MKTLILTMIVLALLTACEPTTSVTIYPRSPSPQPPSRYVGCFTDASSRALPAFLIQTNATVESCIAVAAQAGYRYAGVEYGTQCFAGDVLGYQQVLNSNCNMPCQAATAETCGGYWLMNVYSTGVE